MPLSDTSPKPQGIAAEAAPTVTSDDIAIRRAGIVAALIAGAWMLLPINLTGVLYVVQRMESMANVFVLLGLIGYVAGRRRMLINASRPAGATEGDVLAATAVAPLTKREWLNFTRVPAGTRGFILCTISLIVPTAVGVLAKETAVMLPLYALLIEWALFRFSTPGQPGPLVKLHTIKAKPRDFRIIGLFALVLALPMAIGLAWLLPNVLNPQTWATRDFTLGTRLLSEARIVVDYISWTLAPTPGALSFYHDDFTISTGLLAPWTTLTSIVVLAGLAAFAVWVRARRPLVALGIALFLGCQLLTGTILPLELIYEHRNYFASFGLMLAIVPLLAAPPGTVKPKRRAGTAACQLAAAMHVQAKPADGARPTPNDATFARAEASLPSVGATSVANDMSTAGESTVAEAAPTSAPTAPAPTGPIQPDALPFAIPRYVLLVGLLLFWTGLTAFTAYAWGNPLRLAKDLALRAPLSPRAQYELGRAYIIYSHYDPASPFTPLVYAPLERAAALPDSSILPEQALIFMNARLHLPLRDAWWDSMIAKLKSHPPGVQDESSLGALTQCAREGNCNLPHVRMLQAFAAALCHPHPNARLFATYGDYAWNVLGDHTLGEHMTRKAVRASPNEPAYQITLIRMLDAQGSKAEALDAIKQLQTFNIGGRLNDSLAKLRKLVDGRAEH